MLEVETLAAEIVAVVPTALSLKFTTSPAMKSVGVFDPSLRFQFLEPAMVAVLHSVL